VAQVKAAIRILFLPPEIDLQAEPSASKRSVFGSSPRCKWQRWPACSPAPSLPQSPGRSQKVDQAYPVMSGKSGFARNKWVSVLLPKHSRSRAELFEMLADMVTIYVVSSYWQQ
jgi:hypothetical protein